MTDGMPTDLEIARAARLGPIELVAADMGIEPRFIEQYGRHVAKVGLGVLEEMSRRPPGKYVVVTAMTPTPLGEGKTTITVGLGQAFRYLSKRAVIAIRQPSMGPTFWIKGGAAGGGYSQVVPMESLNLHLTGDMHAVTAAHNLLAAVLDNHLFRQTELGVVAQGDRRQRPCPAQHRGRLGWQSGRNPASGGFRHHSRF